MAARHATSLAKNMAANMTANPYLSANMESDVDAFMDANSVYYLGVHLLGEKLSFSIWIPAPFEAKKWKFAIFLAVTSVYCWKLKKMPWAPNIHCDEPF